MNMRGLSTGPMKAMHGSDDDPTKRRSKRNLKGDKSKSKRSSCCKMLSLKCVLYIVVTCGPLMVLFYPSAVSNEHPPPSGSRPRRVDVELQYESHLDVDWAQILKAVNKLSVGSRNLLIGLLNFNVTEGNYWHQLLPHAEIFHMHLEHARRNLTWEDLYPEWIDEEEKSEMPECPELPDDLGVAEVDLLAVKLPCNRSGDWSRDVARLHLQLEAADHILTFGEQQAHVLFLTNCFPLPNLLTCKDLVMQEGDVWLYNPDLTKLNKKLQIPIGSCKLALELDKEKEQLQSEAAHREAYATILHSAHEYVCGVIALAQSIRTVGSTRDLVVLVDETISDHHRGGLEAAGWKVRTIQRIHNPKDERDAYIEWNYIKFRLWQLTDYDKVIFIDANLLILRNIDFLFTMPEITATGNNATLFNSDVMVIEPSNCTFQLLMDHIDEIEYYKGGDQGYLNEVFTWWHRIPKHMNLLKQFWVGDEEGIEEKKTHLFGADPPVVYILHYLGRKPWLCFRDYDCNWNVDVFWEFASDVAHERWWKVHDAMPENLQSFCLLRSEQKDVLEWDRRQAGKANYPDGHWQRNISDPRLNICIEEVCRWESMDLH